jgi:hypothetical protein
MRWCQRGWGDPVLEGCWHATRLRQTHTRVGSLANRAATIKATSGATLCHLRQHRHTALAMHNPFSPTSDEIGILMTSQ